MKQLSNGNFAALLLALGIAFSGYIIGDAVKYFRNFDRFVEVKGLSEWVVKADKASWQMNFSVSGNNLKQIYSQIKEQQQSVSDFLAHQGFKESEYTQQAILVTDNYAYGNNMPNRPQYTASAGINVTTANVDLVTSAVGQTNLLIESGIILTSNRVNYSYTSLNKIKAAMLNEALANAQVSATQFAQKSQSSLGKIKNAHQGLFTITAPDSNMDDESSIDKKVRVVTTVQFFLK